MEQAASGIGHNVNVDKTNTCSLIKKEDISYSKCQFSEISWQVHVPR